MRWVSVNEMPNLTGVSARPFFSATLVLLKASMLLRRALYLEDFSSASMISSAILSFTCCR